MLRAAVFAILSVASVAACAQSVEYRQGYDQGYRDGAEAQSRADHGGPAGRIIIDEAKYGNRDAGFCNARDAIQRAAGWRRHLDVRANNDLCGDPAPGFPKHLEIKYRCGDSQQAHAEAPEGSIMALSCQ